jgi:hypothetical protein
VQETHLLLLFILPGVSECNLVVIACFDVKCKVSEMTYQFIRFHLNDPSLHLSLQSLHNLVENH